MANGRHLEKSKNGHISATAWPIGAKYGIVRTVSTVEKWNS